MGIDWDRSGADAYEFAFRMKFIFVCICYRVRMVQSWHTYSHICEPDGRDMVKPMAGEAGKANGW